MNQNGARIIGNKMKISIDVKDLVYKSGDKFNQIDVASGIRQILENHIFNVIDPVDIKLIEDEIMDNVEGVGSFVEVFLITSSTGYKFDVKITDDFRLGYEVSC